MAFFTRYGYVTNSNVVPAVALGDERAEGGDTVVDLLLLGVDAGKRYGVLVAASAAAALVNQAYNAEATADVTP